MGKPIARVALVVAAFTVQSCSVPYYAQAVRGQMELLRKRTPIDTVLARHDTDPELARQLTQVQRIRDFATAELGLPENDSYRSYADLDRRFVVWNVVATEEFAVEPTRWCFLLVGCLSYRGFFKQPAAQRFAKRLDDRGLDTFVGGVTAYSTLGYFADPVLNTMLARGEGYVAGLIFHELAHQQLFVKGDSAFSEAFATVVEEHGTMRWLATRSDPQPLAEYRARLRRRDDFAALVARQQARLKELYAEPLSEQPMRAAKAAAFDTLRQEYVALRAAWGGAADYDGWFTQDLNNAHLAAVATYREWVPFLNDQLRAAGSLSRFYARAEALAKLDPGERQARLECWLRTRTANGQPARASRRDSAGGLRRPGSRARPVPRAWVQC
jgi:predicted aminopeptidase